MLKNKISIGILCCIMLLGVGCTITYYESSIGNIGVSFIHPYGNDEKYNKDKVAGIGYMIEIN